MVVYWKLAITEIFSLDITKILRGITFQKTSQQKTKPQVHM